MNTTERDTDHCHITIDDNELFCPIRHGLCLTDRCAMAVHTEDADGSNYYCGLVATTDNIAWNEFEGRALMVPWVKSVMRERI